MSRISCDIIQDLLPLYYDDICSEASRELMEEHLAGCADCRASLVQVKSNLSLPIQEMEVNKLEETGCAVLKGFGSVPNRWLI